LDDIPFIEVEPFERMQRASRIPRANGMLPARRLRGSVARNRPGAARHIRSRVCIRAWPSCYLVAARFGAIERDIGEFISFRVPLAGHVLDGEIRQLIRQLSRAFV